MEVICYACGRGEFPENTLEAIANCQRVNPDWRIEMDLQLSKDGEVILFHDENALRTTGQDIAINQLSMAEITALNAGFYFEQNGTQPYRDAALQVPSLREVLVQFPKAKLLLDIHTANPEVVSQVLALIDKFSATERVVIVSKYDAIVKAFRKLRPKLPYGVASAEAKKMIYSSFLKLDALFPIKGDILMIPHKFGDMTVLNKRIISHALKRNRQIWAWMEEGDQVKTVSKPEEVNLLKGLGATGFFTEHPGRILELNF